MSTDLEARVKTAQKIIAALKARPNSTVSACAAKDLETILRGAIRQRDLGKPNTAARLLEWCDL